jgi:hypothetical protein
MIQPTRSRVSTTCRTSAYSARCTESAGSVAQAEQPSAQRSVVRVGRGANIAKSGKREKVASREKLRAKQHNLHRVGCTSRVVTHNRKVAPLFAFPEQATRRLPTVPTTVGRAALTLLVALVAAGCSPQGPKVAVGKHASTRSCHYEVQIVDPDEAELEVEARCDGSKLSAFIASESVMAALVDDARHQDGRPLKRRDDTFVLPPGADAHIRYRVNLDKVADLTQDIDVAYRVGKSWMSPVSTWALRPDPVPGHATVTIRVHTPEGFDFEAAVHRSGDLYHLESQELRTATAAPSTKRASTC